MFESEKNKKRVVGSKHKILEAAKIEFAEHGLEGARVDRIASLSGANKAMIYYHFQSKENLYRELIKRHIESFTKRLIQKSEQSADLEKILNLVVDTYNDFFTLENRHIVPIFLREMAIGGGQFLELFEQTMSSKGMVSRIIEAYEKGQVEGKYRAIESRQALISFIGMNLFYMLMSPMVNRLWNITDEISFRKERKNIVIDLFLNGIKA